MIGKSVAPVGVAHNAGYVTSNVIVASEVSSRSHRSECYLHKFDPQATLLQAHIIPGCVSVAGLGQFIGSQPFVAVNYRRSVSPAIIIYWLDTSPPAPYAGFGVVYRTIRLDGMDLMTDIVRQRSNLYVVGRASDGMATLRRYDYYGTYHWEKKFYASGTKRTDGSRLKLAPYADGVYVAGSYAFSETRQAAFVSKFDSTGHRAWTRAFGSYDRVSFRAVTDAPDDGVQVSYFKNAGLRVIRYDSSGDLVNIRNFGTNLYSNTLRLLFFDRLFLAGYTFDTAFGGDY